MKTFLAVCIIGLICYTETISRSLSETNVRLSDQQEQNEKVLVWLAESKKKVKEAQEQAMQERILCGMQCAMIRDGQAAERAQQRDPIDGSSLQEESPSAPTPWQTITPDDKPTEEEEPTSE